VLPGQSCGAAGVMVLWVGGMNHYKLRSSPHSGENGLMKNVWLCDNISYFDLIENISYLSECLNLLNVEILN